MHVGKKISKILTPMKIQYNNPKDKKKLKLINHRKY